jgi:hypothetical protein
VERGDIGTAAHVEAQERHEAACPLNPSPGHASFQLPGQLQGLRGRAGTLALCPCAALRVFQAGRSAQACALRPFTARRFAPLVGPALVLSALTPRAFSALAARLWPASTCAQAGGARTSPSPLKVRSAPAQLARPPHCAHVGRLVNSAAGFSGQASFNGTGRKTGAQISGAVFCAPR